MKIKFTLEFSEKLLKQIEYIASDKPIAAKKFQHSLNSEIQNIKSFPFKCRASIFHKNPLVRDLTFKGYTITYKVDIDKDEILVFSFLINQKGF